MPGNSHFHSDMHRFFTIDESSAYDDYVASGTSPRDAIVLEDVVAINTSMRARSPHRDWEQVVAGGDVQELAAVDPAWALFALPNDEWEDEAFATRSVDLIQMIHQRGKEAETPTPGRSRTRGHGCCLRRDRGRFHPVVAGTRSGWHCMRNSSG